MPIVKQGDTGMTQNTLDNDIHQILVEQYTPIANREHRVKRLQFRANHRGMREMDILIGGFVDMYCHTMTDDELDQLEFILSIHDTELSNVLVRFAEPPAVLSAVPMFQRIVDYRDM